MLQPYVLDGPSMTSWWTALEALDRALREGDAAGALKAHAAVARALMVDGHADVAEAVASATLFGEGAWSAQVGRAHERARDPLLAPGAARAARADLHALASVVRRDWQRECETLASRSLPPWTELTLPAEEPDATAGASRRRLREALRGGDVEAAYATLVDAARTTGAGPLARHRAFAWDGTGLRGIDQPAEAGLETLVGLERQLTALFANVEAFLLGRPALATLLYGPRGSGKSSAVRGLLERYGDRGLRLVELPVAHVARLEDVLTSALGQPRRVILMLDDLAVDDDDGYARPLKSLLEGSLRARPDRVLVMATSNRRHLVRERHADRPDPLGGDVRAWDTHHERLALADRFGLTITFPGADRRAYLGIVRHLAAFAGLPADEALEQRALRFAAWGNGYSGRTARQFIDRERADLAEPSDSA